MVAPAFARRTFCPGDLLVFAGEGFESRFIALMSCRPWQLLRGQWFSHIGICARGPAGNVLLFESTTLCELPCEILRRKVKGVQAHKPAERVANHKGRVWRLRLSPRETLSEIKETRLSNFCQAEIGRGYDLEGALISGSLVLRFARTFYPRSDVLFCSDLVMAALKDIGKIDRDLNPRVYSPGRAVRDLCYWGIYQPIGARLSQSARLK